MIHVFIDRIPHPGISFTTDLQILHAYITGCKSNITYSKKHPIYNIPCALDTETSSFYDSEGNKTSVLCEWTVAITNHQYIGRSCEELQYFMNAVTDIFDTHEKRLIIYVHNLSFDFGMIASYFKWKKVFAVDRKKPVYAIMDNGIELRCSYLLTGQSLEVLGKKLKKYPIKKLTGFWDYDAIRTPDTPIDEKTEIPYCLNDCAVLVNYIMEQIETRKSLAHIPLTKTGYIRELCREKCLRESYHYRQLIKQLTITPREYAQLKRTMQGGYTHANAFYSGVSLNKVGSFDFSSSYPYVMCSEKYPMSTAHYIENVTVKQFNKYVYSYNYVCMFDVAFSNIKLKEKPPDSYISSSHCRNVKKADIDNGRIAKADYLETSVTDVDFKIIDECYTYDDMRLSNFCWYDAGYLPKSMILTLLELYSKKTTLKGLTGFTEDGVEISEEYQRAKELLNSVNGMLCTDPIQEVNEYTTYWEEPRMPDILKTLDQYNKSLSRFSVYTWGVWLLAYARANLWQGVILHIGDDYVYSDTDSAKIRHWRNHVAVTENYNKQVADKIKKVSDYYRFPVELFYPKNKHGEPKMMGKLEFEGYYEKFKTLRAKCYMFRKCGKWSLTVSGVNKRVAMPYLLRTYKGYVLKEFKHGLSIPAGCTGKLIHTYIPVLREGDITDKDGNTRHYKQLCGVHLEPTSYNLSITEIYQAYVLQKQHKGGYIYE